jgi:hypothetical protein
MNLNGNDQRGLKAREGVLYYICTTYRALKMPDGIQELRREYGF